jgi:Fe-S cluster assembly iron-binding protein IscA
MFSFTDAAATLISSLIDGADLPEGSGLRFVLDPTQGSLVMGLADSPHTGDRVYRHADASVFVGRSAFPRLGNRTLDAGSGTRAPWFRLD